jgi:hypothetical protein
VQLFKSNVPAAGSSNSDSDEVRFPEGMPRTRTIIPMDPPPQSDNPTTAQLKADIDSGRTGDKIGVFDPGLSPLGTDDEAAGRPPEPERIRLARRLEGITRWANGGRRSRTSHEGPSTALYGFLGVIATIGAVLVAGVALVR